LYVRRREFDAWYEKERQKRIWPSHNAWLEKGRDEFDAWRNDEKKGGSPIQRSRCKPRMGRPSTQNDLRKPIGELRNKEWKTVADLVRLLEEAKGIIATRDTVRRAVPVIAAARDQRYVVAVTFDAQPVSVKLDLVNQSGPSGTTLPVGGMQNSNFTIAVMPFARCEGEAAAGSAVQSRGGRQIVPGMVERQSLRNNCIGDQEEEGARQANGWLSSRRLPARPPFRSRMSLRSRKTPPTVRFVCALAAPIGRSN
jgi:hypothetical protein